MHAFVKLCLTLFVGLFFLSGCSVIYQPTTPLPSDIVLPGPLPPDITSAESSPKITKQQHEPPRSANAIGTLLAKADRSKVSGELETAAATLERAIRIAPKDPILWQHLAQIRLIQKDAVQAESLAAKSNSLAKNSKRILRLNWQIIKEARYIAGDIEGALNAKRRIESLDARN